MGMCPGSHCSTVLEQINNVCKDDGFSGNVVYVLHEGQSCYCNCSCVAVDTLVAVPSGDWKRMGDFKVGDSILALDANNSWTERKVKFSDGTGEGDGNAVPYAIFLSLVNETKLIVTADHAFLLSDRTLQVACRLSPDDKLMDENLRPVGIVNLEYGEYVGGIHNVSTSVGPEGEGLEGHLINTGGIVSGDYYAQLYLVTEQALQQPVIGMPDYLVRHQSVQANIAGPTLTKSETNGSKFVPHRKFIAPQKSASFLPDWMEETEAKNLRPLDDTVPLEIAKYLVNNFKKSYPKITYDIFWNDNTVNAYAWQAGARKHVAILGGLIRHRAVGIEGLGLIIAHEIAHHYGGSPKYSDNPWASCEGQSDYWGAMVAMREVWWGEEAMKHIEKGAEQLYKLFAYGLMSTLSEEEAKKRLSVLGECGHPPADCRRDTYLAAMNLDAKPDCAS